MGSGRVVRIVREESDLHRADLRGRDGTRVGGSSVSDVCLLSFIADASHMSNIGFVNQTDLLRHNAFNCLLPLSLTPLVLNERFPFMLSFLYALFPSSCSSFPLLPLIELLCTVFVCPSCVS